MGKIRGPDFSRWRRSADHDTRTRKADVIDSITELLQDYWPLRWASFLHHYQIELNRFKLPARLGRGKPGSLNFR